MVQSADPAQRLTIGMFTDTYLPETNGVVTSIVATARALRRRGHRVIVVAPAHSKGDEEHPDVFHLRSTSFPFYPGFRMAFPLPAKLVANLPRVPFDIVHAHTFFFIGCLGAYLAHLRKAPLVFTYHTRFEEYQHYLPVQSPITKAQTVWVSREFCNGCDCLISPTLDTADLLHSYGVTKPFEILPTGVDLESFGGQMEEPAALKRARPGPVLLSVGRLGKEKNLDFLLEAFGRVVKQVPSSRLIIAGDGPHRGELEQHAVALGVRDCVEFAGALGQAELGAYYRGADAFVFTSLTETQGLVLVEALAHGLPAVAVDCPVTREVVAGEAGVLIEEKVGAFADALIGLLAESPARRIIRQEAARAVGSRFSVDALAERLEALYLQACRNVVSTSS